MLLKPIKENNLFQHTKNPKFLKKEFGIFLYTARKKPNQISHLIRLSMFIISLFFIIADQLLLSSDLLHYRYTEQSF
jgi:hypothetical protein